MAVVGHWRLVSVIAGLGFLGGCGAASGLAMWSSKSHSIPSAGLSGSDVRRIVILAPGQDSVDAVANDCAIRRSGQIEHIYHHALNGFAIRLPAAEADRLASDTRFAMVADNQSFQTADRTSTAPNHLTPFGIRRTGADRNATALRGQVDSDIAVLDTGIDPTHPDLNVVQSVSFVTGVTTGADDSGHGTHVAGIASGIGAANQVIGMAPGSRLWAVKVLSSTGSGFVSDIIAGIDYVTEHAAEIKVVNMSISGTGSSDGQCGRVNSDPYHAAICGAVAKGVVFVVAAGNGAADARTAVPAAYEEVIAVSAIADTDGLAGGQGAAASDGDADDAVARFSNFGSSVALAAPGVDVTSTWLGGTTHSLSGTSMAAPHVAGAVALYLAKYGGVRDLAGVRQVKSALVGFATPRLAATGYRSADGRHQEPLLNAAAFDPSTPGTPPVTPVTPPALPSLHVSTASYSGGANSSVVGIALQVADQRGLPRAGAALTVELSRQGQVLGNATNTTVTTAQGASSAYFVVRGAPVGCYQLRLVNLALAGFVRDVTADTARLSFCVGANAVTAQSTAAAATANAEASNGDGAPLGVQSPVQMPRSSPAQQPLATATRIEPAD